MRFNQSKLGYMEHAFFLLLSFYSNVDFDVPINSRINLWFATRFTWDHVNAKNQKYFHKICKGSWVHLLAIHIYIPWDTFQMFACLPKDKITFSKHCDGNLCRCFFQQLEKKFQRNNTKERWKRGKNMNLVKSAA